MYNDQYVFWLFVELSSVFVSQTTSEPWTDVQCSYPKPLCPVNSYCWWNTMMKGYYCTCSDGYTWRDGQCRETCTRDRHCPDHSECVDHGYCICDTGYQWIINYCDIDECSSSQLCHQNALCINTPGSYHCTCKPGYTGNGQNCTDIDDCSGPNPCHRSAVCENYPGGYNCTCFTGYSGNGTICTDIDECSDPNPCHRSAVCENYPGGYNCTCFTGYSGNGTICTDIEECSGPNHCHGSAVCENYPGGYNCTFLTGYSRNKTLCTVSQAVEPDALAASTGAIAGGVIGACAFLVVVAVVVLVFILRRNLFQFNTYLPLKPRRKQKSDVGVPMSSSQLMYENVGRSSGVSTTGNTAAVVSPDVDGPHPELYHNNLIKEPKKMQLNQRSEKLDDNLDINNTNDTTYNVDDTGQRRVSPYDRLWETKTEQPSSNFPGKLLNGDGQVNLTADVQICKGAEVYGYDHLKRGVSQPDDNTGHDQEGEVYGHLYGADIDNWDTDNAEIDPEQSNTNVYSLANYVGKD